MNSGQENTIVLGSLRYKGAVNTNLFIQEVLVGKQKEIIDSERSITVNLPKLYQDERQKSNIFRPSAKFDLIFKNSYVGKTDYRRFQNQLYYTNVLNDKIADVNNGSAYFAWQGFPQYNEFDFIRNDNDLAGWTLSGNTHLITSQKDVTERNWYFYMSYVYKGDPNVLMRFYEGTSTSPSITWGANRGIPFKTGVNQIDGKNLVTFKCITNHGLSVGESVNLLINGSASTVTVYSLGDGSFGSDEFIFNLYNVWSDSLTPYPSNLWGTAKRVLRLDASGNSISEYVSKYYVRVHKIITKNSDKVLTKAGFNQNAYRTTTKYESSALTPNLVSRISVKEGSQEYNLSFNTDIDVTNLIDNQKRPVSEIFYTIINKGQFGWFNRPVAPIQQGIAPKGLLTGWEFNMSTSNSSNYWWDTSTQPLNTDNIQLLNYTRTSGVTKTFYYNDIPKNGEIYGDLCEWNDLEQIEKVVSKRIHKLKFNQDIFVTDTNTNNSGGYYYYPFYSQKIRQFSNYLEEGDPLLTTNIPDYAYYSTNNNLFYWRDIYDYGIFDSDNQGINFPYSNDGHYPYSNYVFKIIPEGSNFADANSNQDNLVQLPLSDACE
jgi:hypothetical protein